MEYVINYWDSFREFLDLRKLTEEGDDGEEQDKGGIESEESECQVVKRLIESQDDSCDSPLHKLRAAGPW